MEEDRPVWTDKPSIQRLVMARDAWPTASRRGRYAALRLGSGSQPRIGDHLHIPCGQKTINMEPSLPCCFCEKTVWSRLELSGVTLQICSVFTFPVHSSSLSLGILGIWVSWSCKQIPLSMKSTFTMNPSNWWHRFLFSSLRAARRCGYS